MTVEDRVIHSSLTMIEKGGKKKNSELIRTIFDFFAVFPEDVMVPIGVFVALAPLLTGGGTPSKKGNMQLKTCLTTLVNCECDALAPRVTESSYPSRYHLSLTHTPPSTTIFQTTYSRGAWPRGRESSCTI